MVDDVPLRRDTGKSDAISVNAVGEHPDHTLAVESIFQNEFRLDRRR